jgi:predicted acyltransferase
VLGLALAGAVGLVAGTMLDSEGLCPIVKRIWTPSWVLYSTGWTCWLLAAFYGVVDVAGKKRWAFPLVVVGMNSIAIYVMSQLLKPYVGRQLRIHAGTLLVWLRDRWGMTVNPDPFAGASGPVIRSLAILAVFWLVCLWLYRRRIFLRI